MARKIPAKLILEYRAMGLSRNMIAKTKSVGKSSVSDVFQRADELHLAYEDIKNYRMRRCTVGCFQKDTNQSYFMKCLIIMPYIVN